MSFDRLARFYPWMEIILADRKMQGVPQNVFPGNPRHVLILGEGHGHSVVENAGSKRGVR